MKVFSKNKYYANGVKFVTGWPEKADGHEVSNGKIVGTECSCSGKNVDAWCVDAPHELTDEEIKKRYTDDDGFYRCGKLCPAHEHCVPNVICAANIRDYFMSGNWHLEKSKPDIGIPTTDEPSTRRTVLEQAIQCVCADRDKQYGSPEDSFSVIAELWIPYIQEKCVNEKGKVCITAHDVGMLETLLKIGRIATGHYKPDNYVDAAGYLACAAECGETLRGGAGDE